MDIGDGDSGVETGMVVLLFKNGDQRVCSNCRGETFLKKYRGITFLNLPGKVYSSVLVRRVPLLNLDYKRKNAVFFLDVERWTSSILLQVDCKGHGSSEANQSRCSVDLKKAYDHVF